MASVSMVSRLSPVSFQFVKGTETKESDENVAKEDGDMDDVIEGAKLSEKQIFGGKKGKEITVTPVIVDFLRLLQTKSAHEVVPGIPNRELLHAVIGLYSVSLSEMTPEVLYATVCERWARTIILLRDVKETIDDLESRKERAKNKPPVLQDGLVNGQATAKELTRSATSPEEEDRSLKEEACTPEPKKSFLDCLGEITDDTDIYEPGEEKPSMFSEVFSDTDEEESDAEEEDEDDTSRGVKSFLKAVAERREARNKNEGPITLNQVGVENRLVAALTFKKAYCKPGDRVVHLTLVCVRKRFQKAGIGKYLLSQTKNPDTVGQYDAVVVHADNAAMEFFERYGFSDDIVLNSRWSELAEQFTNCTLMSYLPPFTGQTLVSNSVPELDIIAMEKEIKKWRDKAIEAHKAEISCMSRLRTEVIHLRALTSSQQDLITSLIAELEKVRREKFVIEKEFLNYRLTAARAAFLMTNEHLDDDDDDDAVTANLIERLQRHARLSSGDKEDESNEYMLSHGNHGEPYCHGKDTEDFYNITEEFFDAVRKDPTTLGTNYQVKMLSKAILTKSVSESFTACAKSLGEPIMATRMFFCGTLERPDQIPIIMKNGFSENDFAHGEYGVGLYFSKFPSKAAQFSSIGKLLLCEVTLGNTETVLKQEVTRKKTSEGFNSILTPGRLSPQTDTDNDLMLCQEYVIFDIHQAAPLYLIEFNT